MTSFQISLPANRRAATRFIGQVRRALQKAYVEEQASRGLSQSEIARLLQVHRSVINRELRGLGDMTLGRVAELAWAMGRSPYFSAEEAPAAKNVGRNFPAAQPVQGFSVPSLINSLPQPVALPGVLPQIVPGVR